MLFYSNDFQLVSDFTRLHGVRSMYDDYGAARMSHGRFSRRWKKMGDGDDFGDVMEVLGTANTHVYRVTQYCVHVYLQYRKLDEAQNHFTVDRNVDDFLVAENGASCTQGTVSSIPIVGSISPEGFLSLILLLVVIIATVVVTVVVVVAIVGVVIVVAVIGVVVVVGGVSFIIKLLY
ncbi:hypothetical protein Tco_1291886 [Tanacetum coccineum]